MKNKLLFVWAVMATVVATALGVLHFGNPYPLIQIPDRGHRLYSVPDERTHNLLLEVFRMAGAQPYGTFTAGVHHTLMMDGFTVLAYGEGIQGAAISFPVAHPRAAAEAAHEFLSERGITASIFVPSMELGDKLVVLRLPFGWDVTYRLQGRNMPQPAWERKY